MHLWLINATDNGLLLLHTEASIIIFARVHVVVVYYWQSGIENNFKELIEGTPTLQKQKEIWIFKK